ncbi:hypothetical protein QJQ45_006662 [Haematococcus lacustris]|nr:hypothetical protein QJQ45_006662 [Haematococcus lacustris]
MPELSFEEQKKAVVPFLQALQLEKRHKDINGLVASTLASLEKSKLTLTLDQESDRYHCESFALKIFSNADRTDRAGRADVNTAKAFFAASFFLEILNQFGPLDADLLGKQRYAAWRATEIRKAIREGRPPLPPPSSDAAQAQQAAGGEAFNLEPGSSLPPANLAPGPPDASWNPDPTTLHPSSPSQAFAAETEAAAGAAQEGGEGGWAEGAHGPGTPPQGMGAPYGGLQGDPPDPAVGQAERPSSNGAGREGGEGDRGQGGGALAGQRFARGSPVLFCAEPGRWHPERGTVGQVLGPGGPQGCRYTVALPHVFVEAADAQLAPAPPEGAQLYWRPHPQQPGVGVWMLQVKDEASWPPSYLVCFPDGSERIAEAHQLSFLPDPPQLSQPPPIPGPGAEHASQPLPGWLMQDSQSPFGNPQPPQPPAWGGSPPLVPAGPGSRGGDHAGVNAAAHNQGHPGLAPTPPPPRPTSTLAASPSPSKPAIYGASSNLPTTGPANPPLPSPPCTQSSRGGPAAAGPVPSPTPAMAMQAGGHGGAGHGVWVPALPPGHKPSLAAITEAQKAARVAISSLNFEDAASAVKHLTQAIALLTKPRRAMNSYDKFANPTVLLRREQRQVQSILWLVSLSWFAVFIASLGLASWNMALLRQNTLLGLGRDDLIRVGCVLGAVYDLLRGLGAETIGLSKVPAAHPHNLPRCCRATATRRMIESKQWWRLVASPFVSAGAIQLATNTSALWTFGLFLSSALSPWQLGLLLLLSGAAGATVSANVSSAYVTAASSGPAFGLMGGMCATLMLHHRLFTRHLVTVGMLGATLALNLWVGATPFADNRWALGTASAALTASSRNTPHAPLITSNGSMAVLGQHGGDREWLLRTVSITSLGLALLIPLLALLGLFAGLPLDGCCDKLVCAPSKLWDCNAAQLPAPCTFLTPLPNTTTLLCPQTNTAFNYTGLYSPTELQMLCDANCFGASITTSSNPDTPSSQAGQRATTMSVPG